MQPEIAELHSHLIPQLAILARNMVRDLDPQVRTYIHMVQTSASIHFLGTRIVAVTAALVQCISAAYHMLVMLQNDLEFLRIRSMKQEVMVAPRKWHTTHYNRSNILESISGGNDMFLVCRCSSKHARLH